MSVNGDSRGASGLVTSHRWRRRHRQRVESLVAHDRRQVGMQLGRLCDRESREPTFAVGSSLRSSRGPTRSAGIVIVVVVTTTTTMATTTGRPLFCFFSPRAGASTRARDGDDGGSGRAAAMAACREIYESPHDDKSHERARGCSRRRRRRHDRDLFAAIFGPPIAAVCRRRRGPMTSSSTTNSSRRSSLST